MECEVCGGTNFFKESGFFYCGECQTQSQELREHVFQDDFTNHATGKKIAKKKTEKVNSKVTSWECYNIIIHGLTQQLIKLGAKQTLKPVVKCLWMKYLQKLEVLNFDIDTKPKLQLYNSRKDVEILYNTPKKKRKRPTSSDESSLSLTSNQTSRSQSKIRAKKKLALATAQYEEHTQESLQDISLQTETLSSLKSSSEKRSEKSEKLQFNRYSISEMKKFMSTSHYHKHKKDKMAELKCHKITVSKGSYSYTTSVYYISPIKIYCLLYLGLLIVKDEIQLSDLLRFINENHLSLNHYNHLFPEEYVDKFLNITKGRTKSFVSRMFRKFAAKMVKFLKISAYIQTPNLVEISKRYCKELNLPDSICQAVQNLLSRTKPKFLYVHYNGIIPNYEGRIMSFIIFVLKLLYGLDDVTEFYFSKCSRSLNGQLNNKMFDIIKWMEYIGHRNVVITNYHFPSVDKNCADVNSDLFLQYIQSHNIIYDKSKHLTKEINDHKEILEKIQRLQNDYFENVQFSATLTPFLDYSRVLLNSNIIKNKISVDLLNKNFQSDSIDFLLYLPNYLNSETNLKHGGANDNWIMHKIRYVRYELSPKEKSLIPIQVIDKGQDDLSKICNLKCDNDDNQFDVNQIQLDYEKCHEPIFKKNYYKLKKLCDLTKTNSNVCIDDETGAIHYVPYERYWLNLQFALEEINKNDFDNFFESLPKSFKLLFQECCRIIEQSSIELFDEFQLTELFFVYSTDFGTKKRTLKPRKMLNNHLKYYINKAELLW